MAVTAVVTAAVTAVTAVTGGAGTCFCFLDGGAPGLGTWQRGPLSERSKTLRPTGRRLRLRQARSSAVQRSRPIYWRSDSYGM